MLPCPIACAARRLPSASRSPTPSRWPIRFDRAQQRVAAAERAATARRAVRARRTPSRRRCVPPALIVSMPSSSQRCDARSTASRVADAAQRAEREQALVLERAPSLVADRVDVLAADGAGHAARARPRVRRRSAPRGERLAASSNVPLWKLRVGSAPKRLNVSRFVAVPELAVLRRRRAERPLRQIAAERGQLARVRPLAALRPAHGDRLDVLAAQHRAAAAAAGVPAVVRDRRVADRALAGRPDRRDAVVGAEPRAQRRFGLLARRAAQIRRPARAGRRRRR